MRFLRRSLVGIFLLSVTLALMALAGNLVRGAVTERMAQEPRSFPQLGQQGHKRSVKVVKVVKVVGPTMDHHIRPEFILRGW